MKSDRTDSGQHNVSMEIMEGRLLMSASASSLGIQSLVAEPAITVHRDILRPSQVEGTYSGPFTVHADGQSQSINVEFTVSSDSLYVRFDAYQHITLPIKSSQFRKLRDGSFKESRTVSGESVTVSWTVSNSGRKFNGSFDVSGSTLTADGVFSLTKIS